MKANAEKIENNTVLLEIEVDEGQFSQAMDKAYRKLVKQYNIPGFRKGKTPRPIFERYMGKEVLYEEAMETLVPDAYIKAVKDTGIEPIDRPKLEIVQAEEGKPVLLKATVQVKPDVKLGQYKDLEIAKQSTEISDTEVDEALEKLQARHAKLLTLDEGTVEKGDVAVIDFLGKINGEPFAGGEGKDHPLEIGSGAFIAGFEDQVTGMSVGETKDIEVVFPEDYKAEDLAGKNASFTVTVKEIKRKELSPLDDEFAKDVSDFDTLEELRSDISNKLSEAANDRAESQFKADVVEKAVDNAEVEIPEIMIDYKLGEMMDSMARRLAAQGLSMENYLKFTNTTWEAMRENMRPEALRNVKTELVLDAIAKVEDVKATDEEMQEEISKIGSFYRGEPEKFQEILRDEEHLNYISEGVVRQKTVEFLVDNTSIAEDTKEPDTE